MLRKLLILTIILAAAGIGRAQQTKLLTPDKFSDYGLVYTLPETALEIEVEARHTIQRAGAYYPYAKKQIGTDKVIKADDDKWEVIGVKVRSYGIANDSAQYKMQLKAGVPTTLCVAEDGMLLSINTKVDAPEEWAPLVNPAPVEIPTGNEYLQYVGEDFLASQSSATRAQMLAESLMEVREARLSLTRGTAETMPTDGKQLELMLNSLKDQEDCMVQAFCGTTITETRSARFTFLPDKDGRYVLARLSDFSGFVDAEDLSGSPIIIKVETQRHGEIPLDEKGNPRQQPKEGVAYCIPGSALVTISWDGKTFYSKELDMAQSGVVFSLDPTIFTSKKSPSFAIFDPTTGAVKELGAVNQ
jgi:hypothetical protein